MPKPCRKPQNSVLTLLAPNDILKLPFEGKDVVRIEEQPCPTRKCFGFSPEQGTKGVWGENLGFSIGSSIGMNGGAW
jgi:hypothetical protein